MQDSNVTKHIESLVNEEYRLFGKQDMQPQESARLKAIQVELDRCWDLLRQRRAKREFGKTPMKLRYAVRTSSRDTNNNGTTRFIKCADLVLRQPPKMFHT